MEDQKITLSVTLGGKTRDVEFTVWSDGARGSSEYVFVARTPRGSKTHRCAMRCFLQNGKWITSTRVTVLNTQATIVGFGEMNPATSQHISTKA